MGTSFQRPDKKTIDDASISKGKALFPELHLHPKGWNHTILRV